MKQYPKNLVIFTLFLFLLITIANTISTSQKTQQPAAQSSKSDLSSSQQANNNKLFLQKSKRIELNSKQVKRIIIDKQSLLKQIQTINEELIMSKFVLNVKRIVGSIEISISVFNKSTKTLKVYLNTTIQKDQFNTIKLDFLSQFTREQIEKIQIQIISSDFYVIELTLMNHLLSDQIDLNYLQVKQTKNQITSIWLPQTYDVQNQKHYQTIKYLMFKPSQLTTKFNLKRVIGHPKIFLYNCQSDKIDFCKQQIQKDHIDGTLMVQKQITLQIKKQNHCNNCFIILSFKNMGVQTLIEISYFLINQSVIVSKGQVITKQLKKHQNVQFISYFQLLQINSQISPFLDISIIQGNQQHLEIQISSITSISGLQNANQQNQLKVLNQQSLKIIRLPKLIRIFIQNQTSTTLLKKQFWYRISLKLSANNYLLFTIVDMNWNSNDHPLLTLNDGEILHLPPNQLLPNSTQSKIDINTPSSFRIKVQYVSVLSISTQCSQFNHLQIIMSPQTTRQITKINPKTFIQNITNSHQQCTQLIHLNPLKNINLPRNQQIKQNNQKEYHSNQLNHNQSHQKESNQKEFSQQEYQFVDFKVSGFKKQIILLYNALDMIYLEKQYSYSSQLHHTSSSYFYVRHIKQSAIIQIQKCSQCHVNLMISQGQLADLKQKNRPPIMNYQVKSIKQKYIYKVNNNNVPLYIRINTNNFAYFAIKVTQNTQPTDQETKNTQQLLSHKIKREITFSLVQNGTLTLEFPTPYFTQISSLNSITHFSLIQGSISTQVGRQTYCPRFIFNQKQRTRDVSISQIQPVLYYDQKGNQILKYSMQLKHHDFFGIRAQKGDQIFSYTFVNIQMMKQYSQYRWSIFNVLLFLTFALCMSFVCFMALKRKKIRKIGGQIIEQNQDGEQTSMVNLK